VQEISVCVDTYSHTPFPFFNAHTHTASLGSLLEFAKIIDKLGEFLCDSGEVFTEETAAVTPAPDCGVVGQVLNFVKATVDLLLSFIDGAIDFLIGLLNEALLKAIPTLRSLFTPFDLDSAWVSSRFELLLSTRSSFYQNYHPFSSLIALPSFPCLFVNAAIDTYLLLPPPILPNPLSYHSPTLFSTRASSPGVISTI